MKMENVWNADSKATYETIKKMEKEMNESIEIKLTAKQLDDVVNTAYHIGKSDGFTDAMKSMQGHWLEVLEKYKSPIDLTYRYDGTDIKLERKSTTLSTINIDKD